MAHEQPPAPPHIGLRQAAPPREAQETLQRALLLQRAGRLREAIAAYEAILAKTPNLPAIQLQLGLAHKTAGDLAAATAALRRALELDPGKAETHHALAGTLAACGELQAAAAHALQAVRLAPQTPAFRRGLAGLLPRLRFAEARPEVVAAVEICFRDDGIDHQSLIPATLALLRQDEAVSGALALPDDAAGATALQGGGLAGLLGHSLLRLVLTKAVIADEDFERLFTGLRRAFLKTRAELDRTPESWLDFAVALACQCDLCGYGYAEGAEEAAEVAALQARLQRARTLTSNLVVLALYRPIAALANTERLAEAAAPSDALVLLQRRFLVEPREERRLATEIPTLTPISDAVSEAMWQRDEALPHPRWRAYCTRPARPLHQVVARILPRQAPVDPLPEPIEVLIAGCGTGKSAIEAATRYQGSRVLAIDLDKTALAYGLRQARARGLETVSFAQADILALNLFDRRFDLIDCVDLLPRLADPMEGWGRLAAHLKPGGFMRLGLHSARRNSLLAPARHFVAEKGFESTQGGVRAARQAILALAQDHPAREVVGEVEFYSLQGCRDLLFSLQEQEFTLPRIETTIAHFGLAFLGFEFPTQSVPQAYARRFPEDRSMTDLTFWHRFEQEAPATFGRGYRFWCRLA